MRKNFNFKAEWAVAIQMLGKDIRLCVYQIILTMGLHDVSLDDAMAANGVAVSDSEAMNLLVSVEKVLMRRRRARERAAARRLAKNAVKTPANDTCISESSDSGIAESAVAMVPISHGTEEPAAHDMADDTIIPTSPRRRRHKHKKRRCHKR